MAGLRNLISLICLSIFLPLQAMAAPSSSTFFSLASVMVPIAIVITILLIPYFYNRTLKDRGSKSLRGFMLNDPKTREMLLSKIKQEQSPEEGEQKEG